jgi:hypothetical protein
MGTRGILTLALTLGLSVGAAADGIPFKGDRYDGPATVIKLTHDQDRMAEFSDSGVITLTFGQKAKLLIEAGTSVDKVDVWSVANAKDTCTCELEDMGIEFAPGVVEIPHEYLSNEPTPCWNIAYRLVVWGLVPLALVRAGCWWAKRRGRRAMATVTSPGRA